MKINKLFILIVFLLAGSLFTNVYSQSNLKKWIANAQKEKAVDVTVIQRRDKKTKKLEQDFHSISFTSNPSLLEGYKIAAEKDRDQAIKVSDTKRKGETTGQVFEFYDEKTDMVTKVIFSISSTKRVTISITTRKYEDG